VGLFLTLLVTFVPSVPLFVSFLVNGAFTSASYTLSLHDALPISKLVDRVAHRERVFDAAVGDDEVVLEVLGHRAFRLLRPADHLDRKSTRLNSSHVKISYAVFCLKKKDRK